MKRLLYIIGLIILFSCKPNKPNTIIESNNVTKSDSTIKTDSIKNTSIVNTNNSDRMITLYVSMNKDAYVLGDSISKRINYLAIKFEPHVLFSDFKVDSIYQGVFNQIDYNSNPNGKQFKTRIKEAYSKNKVNFAGHYCFVEWGCGLPCQYSVIVDVTTGKIYNGLSSALDYEFQRDSRMIIVNPVNYSGIDLYHPKPGYFLDCPYCKPEIYIWNEEKKIFEQR
jgi:hypothetical protein